MAFFCSKSGVRIVAPGVSKAVDPINGCDEVDGEATDQEAAKAPKASSKRDAGSSESKS